MPGRTSAPSPACSPLCDPRPVMPAERATATDARPEAGEGPLVAIAMATYEPDAAMFEIQIESIRAQTHRSWICLISDDGSGPAARELIERVAGGDPRFAIDFAPSN